MTKASIKFYPNKEKKSRKNGKIPMYLRIINNCQKAECRLPIEICESELQNWNPIVQRFENNKSNINRFLNKFEQEFEDIKYSFALNINSLTANEIINKVTGNKSKDNSSLSEYFNSQYNKFILSDSEKSEGTKKNYHKALKHLLNYLEYANKRNITFNQVERAFPEQFKEYLLAEIPSIKKSRMSEVSASGNIKKIKTFFKRAVCDGLIERNPFEGFKLKTKSPKKEKLTSMQVRAIYKEDWNNTTLEKVADIFLFSVFSGLAYSDAMGLKKTTFQKWDEGNVFIHIKRKKTDEDTRIFLVSYALRIIDKYKNEPQVQNQEYALPQICNQVYNRWLKIIACKVGISFNLTSHSARHTFRVMLNEANITDTAVRKTMIGHSLQRDIDGIYNEVREQQLLDAKDLYQMFLDKLFTKE